MDQSAPGAPELLLFLASTVHDMKNSISVVSGTLEALLAGGPAALANADTAADATSAYTRMAQMLYQSRRLNDNLMHLLALYKQVGKPAYPFDPQPLLVSQLVEQLVAQQTILLTAHGIGLDVSCPPKLLWTCDEDLVLGVLAQAVHNAVRYTHNRIRLAVAERDGMLEIRVEDNGTGYPAALLEAGVAAMSGVTSGVSFATNSTGLGLYFASEVAKMHKHRGRAGSIELDNGGVLRGGCFILRLP